MYHIVFWDIPADALSIAVAKAPAGTFVIYFSLNFGSCTTMINFLGHEITLPGRISSIITYIDLLAVACIYSEQH